MLLDFIFMLVNFLDEYVHFMLKCLFPLENIYLFTIQSTYKLFLAEKK